MLLNFSRIVLDNKEQLNPLSARKMTSFGLWLSEATQLHNGAWVAALLGPSLGSRTVKTTNFHERYIVHLALKG